MRYLHLAHSEWDPVAGCPVPRLLHSFGREDRLDRNAIKRLADSLDELWHRLGLPKAITSVPPADLRLMAGAGITRRRRGVVVTSSSFPESSGRFPGSSFVLVRDHPAVMRSK
ncbi:hypothetical protein AB0I02_37155 [Streptomyces phaeochromogenes]